MEMNHQTNHKDTITRRDFVKSTAAVGAASALPGVSSSAYGRDKDDITRPNVLFIMTDQQSWDMIGAYGKKRLKTPNLDRLVERGSSFMLSHSALPVCGPARAALFTGRMPTETGVLNNKMLYGRTLSKRETFGKTLKKSGYNTYYTGKSHLGQVKHMDGFEFIPSGMMWHAGLADRVRSRSAQGFFHNYKEEKPFCLAVSLHNPHDICWSTYMYEKPQNEPPFSVRPETLPELPTNMGYDKNTPEAMSFQVMEDWTDMNWRYYNYTYYKMIEEVDSEIGRVLDALEASPYADNTIIVFTSDHGDGRGCHSTKGKHTSYDESIRVPLIVAGPGIPAGNVDNTSIVSGVDIAPTIIDYAGVKESDRPKMTGKSLRPVLEGSKDNFRDYLVSEFHLNAAGRMVRSNKYKYSVVKQDPIRVLFDMENDPGEQVNLIDDPKYKGIIEEHQDALDRWEDSLDVYEYTS